MIERLDRDSAEALVRALAGLAKSQGLYPSGHATVRRAEESVMTTLREALRQRAPLLLGNSDGYLVVGDVAFLGAPAQAMDMTRLLEQKEVEGVIVEPEVEVEEVRRFVAWLRDPDAEPWAGQSLNLTRLSPGGKGWDRAARVHKIAVEALEKAYQELEEGRIPDPRTAQECVREFSVILAENPELVKGLVLIKDYDRYTFHHSVNVSLLSLLLGRQLGLTEEGMECLGISGLFHDIGKTRTPQDLVRKPGRLTSAEWSMMWLHPTYGREILAEMEGLPGGTAEVVYEHHMRHDGGGYPPRDPDYVLTALSPVVTVADVYDAMTTHRSYSSPLPLPEAVAAMERLKGSHFLPQALDAFLEVMGRVPVGSVIRLRSGEVGVVTQLTDRGEVRGARVVASGDGRRLRPDEVVVRAIGPGDVAHWVNPLIHGIDPVEFVKDGL